VKTAVSMPDDLFAAGEQLAARLGWGRSRLYAKALEEFVARAGEDVITARLDEVYGPPAGGDADDDIGVRAARALIDDGSWEW
jgi:hypothetical protein